jgi:hypothetical protein
VAPESYSRHWSGDAKSIFKEITVSYFQKRIDAWQAVVDDPNALPFEKERAKLQIKEYKALLRKLN